MYINHFAVLVHRSPEITLFAVYLDEHFINVEGIAVPAMSPLQSARVDSSELDTGPAPSA